ncbi:MAG: hypothetical protein JG767_1611 [Deferribacteraceae bacterium]|nr:hypothetical protein [Deferribacteraceae bacterium]
MLLETDKVYVIVVIPSSQVINSNMTIKERFFYQPQGVVIPSSQVINSNDQKPQKELLKGN